MDSRMVTLGFLVLPGSPLSTELIFGTCVPNGLGESHGFGPKIKSSFETHQGRSPNLYFNFLSPNLLLGLGSHVLGSAPN